MAPWYGQAHGSYAEPVFVGPSIRSTAAFRWGTDGGKAGGSRNGADLGDVVIQIRQGDVDAGVGLRGCAGSSEARNSIGLLACIDEHGDHEADEGKPLLFFIF